MTERLPFTDEVPWQNILGAADGTGGFLRVAHNDDGSRKEVFDVQELGVVADGVTDQTAEIQVIIDSVPSIGGTVYFPDGIYVVNGTLDLTDKQMIRLKGAGAQSGNYFGAPTKGTVLKRVSGTGKMLTWTPTVTTGTALRGTGIEGIAFWGGILSTVCVELYAHYGGVFRDVFLGGATSVGLDLSGRAVTDIGTLQACLFENISINVVNSAGAIGLRIGSEGNVSLNTFVNTFVHVNSASETGIEFGASDSNNMYGVVSTGVVKFLADNDSARFCADNALYNVAATGYVSEGTASGSTPATNNVVFACANNTPYVRPTIGAGSTFHYSDTKGYTLPEYRFQAEIKDDFLSGGTATGLIGELGWNTNGVGTFTIPSAAGHPGIVRLDTTASSGTYSAFGPTINGSSTMLTGTDFDLTFVVRLNTNDANTQVRLGLLLNFTDGTTDGIYFEKLFADTSWFGVIRVGSSDTRTAAVAATSTNWVVLRMRQLGGTQTIGFTAGGGTEVVNSATLPVVYVQPVVSIKNNAAAAKTLDVDYFNWQITNLART